VVSPAFNVEPQRSGHDQENNLAISKRNVEYLDVTPKPYFAYFAVWILRPKRVGTNAQQVEKVRVSVLIGKNLSLFQAAVDHVVPPAFNVEPQRSGHDQENNLASAERNVKG
jgi:hypothetical protein